MHELILREIRRLASDSSGNVPGQKSFAAATGVAASKWRGVFWARSGDALKEAGFAPNDWGSRRDEREMVTQIATFVSELGRVPTPSEMRLRRRADPMFPVLQTIKNHFSSRSGIIAALREFATTTENNDLLALLPATVEPQDPRWAAPKEGSVYLLKSGNHYKIGRSDQIERRIREVTIAQPEAVTLVHTITTDDPPGIEAYWHRRFADRRANGEWFRLTGDDVRAFTRRKFQ